jgi:hypothetical protein
MLGVKKENAPARGRLEMKCTSSLSWRRLLWEEVEKQKVNNEVQYLWSFSLANGVLKD